MAASFVLSARFLLPCALRIKNDITAKRRMTASTQRMITHTLKRVEENHFLLLVISIVLLLSISYKLLENKQIARYLNEEHKILLKLQNKPLTMQESKVLMLL